MCVVQANDLHCAFRLIHAEALKQHHHRHHRHHRHLWPVKLQSEGDESLTSEDMHVALANPGRMYVRIYCVRGKQIWIVLLVNQTSMQYVLQSKCTTSRLVSSEVHELEEYDEEEY